MNAIRCETNSRAFFGTKRWSWATSCLAGIVLILWASPCRAQFSSLPKAEDVISLRPPTPDQLFQLKSEKAFQAILKAEASRKPGALPVIFPEAPAVQQQPYLGRAWPHQVRTTVPGYVCYNRLYFEQLNFERYGWDLGVLTPFLSAGLFYYDVAALPFHAAIDPCRTYECGVGYCAPGDPVPLMLYWSHLRNGGQNPCSPCEGK